MSSYVYAWLKWINWTYWKMIFEHLLDYIASIFCLIWTYTGKHIFSLVFKHKIYEDKTKYHWWWWNLIDYYLLIFSWLIVGYYSISFIECRPRFIESSVHYSQPWVHRIRYTITQGSTQQDTSPHSYSPPLRTRTNTSLPTLSSDQPSILQILPFRRIERA